MCSDDNGSEERFQPVTIDLTNLSISGTDTSFRVQGYDFIVERAESQNSGYRGIILAFPDADTNFSKLEMNLQNTNAISNINISLFNNCSACLDITVLNGNKVVSLIKGTQINSGDTEVNINIDKARVTALRIESLETIVSEIKLE